jgi:glycerophosphoryl diester phosphodiesterase
VSAEAFETTTLRRLRAELRVPLVQLLSADGARPTWSPPATRALRRPDHAGRLAEIAGYADAIGPEKDQIIGRDADGRLTEVTALVEEAHAAGLLVR